MMARQGRVPMRSDTRASTTTFLTWKQVGARGSLKSPQLTRPICSQERLRPLNILIVKPKKNARFGRWPTHYTGVPIGIGRDTADLPLRMAGNRKRDSPSIVGPATAKH